jgi:hypothetical protein
LTGLGATICALDIKDIAEFPTYMPGAVLISTCALGLIMVWSLTGVKRMVGILALLDADLTTLEDENTRVNEMQQQKKKDDEEMKGKLAQMEQAQILLKGNVANLESVEKQNDAMVEERGDLLSKRRELAADMKRTMKDLHSATLLMAREELSKRMIIYFDDNAENEEIVVGSLAWSNLKVLAENLCIELDEEAAGADGKLDKFEFYQWVDWTMDYHFLRLEKAVRRNDLLQEEITSLKIARRAQKVQGAS